MRARRASKSRIPGILLAAQARAGLVLSQEFAVAGDVALVPDGFFLLLFLQNSAWIRNISSRVTARTGRRASFERMTVVVLVLIVPLNVGTFRNGGPSSMGLD